MRNYSVVMQQFDKICSCCGESQEAALSQLRCVKVFWWAIAKVLFNFKVERRDLIKCNDIEATMIYRDKGIIEERDRNAEVDVKNMSEIML